MVDGQVSWTRRSAARIGGVGLALALVVAAAWWGRRIDPHLFGNTAAPLLGHLVPRWSATTWVAVAVGVAGVLLTPHIAARWPLRRMAVAMWGWTAAWAFALAGSDGIGGIVNQRGINFEYLSALPHVHSWAHYLAGFSTHIHDNAQFVWPVHVAGNPPGALLFFSALSRLGLGGTAWASVVVVLIGTSATTATIWATREIAGEALARRAAPFLALAPMAVWVATSADALFLGISAWGVALVAAAATRRGMCSDSAALAGGLVLGASLYLSYGLAPLGGLVVAVCCAHRRLRPLLVAAIGVAAVVVCYAAFGYLWWHGLAETVVRAHQGVQASRPYGYFLLANLAALAIAVGPATAAGLANLSRAPRLGWLVAGAGFAVLVADLSGISRGEVERIWLPFMPWLIVACAALSQQRASRPWLAAQVALGLLVQTTVLSFW